MGSYGFRTQRSTGIVESLFMVHKNPGESGYLAAPVLSSGRVGRRKVGKRGSSEGRKEDRAFLTKTTQIDYY